jgi:predicted HTH domain antitoxin
MSEFAFFRFMSNSMLNLEEQQHKDEIIASTEDVLKAKGIDCDSKISKMSEEQLKEILEEVRKRRRKKNNKDKNRQEIDVAVQ